MLGVDDTGDLKAQRVCEDLQDLHWCHSSLLFKVHLESPIDVHTHIYPPDHLF